MSSLANLKAEKEKLITLSEQVQLKIDEKLKHKMIKCEGYNRGQTGCGRRSQVRKLEYIQTYWYVRPTGCMEGDYWQRGEGQFVCPHCGHLNRLHSRPEVEKLARYFKKIVESNDKD